MPSADFNWLR